MVEPIGFTVDQLVLVGPPTPGASNRFAVMGYTLVILIPGGWRTARKDEFLGGSLGYARNEHSTKVVITIMTGHQQPY